MMFLSISIAFFSGLAIGSGIRIIYHLSTGKDIPLYKNQIQMTFPSGEIEFHPGWDK